MSILCWTSWTWAMSCCCCIWSCWRAEAEADEEIFPCGDPMAPPVGDFSPIWWSIQRNLNRFFRVFVVVWDTCAVLKLLKFI